jgi:hypothetical protein
MPISWRVIRLIVGTLSLSLIFVLYSPKQSDSHHLVRRLKQIEWGGFFGSSAATNGIFPKMVCQFAGRDICCSAVQNVEKKISKPKHFSHCTVRKEYYPSPYELRHLEKAEEFAKIADLHDRTVEFVNFIESVEEIEHATKWLARVAQRQGGDPVAENEVDREYLSRFKVTRKCGYLANQTSWEYIEPLSVHGRHPFGLGDCWHPHHRDKIPVYDHKAPKASLLSVDYLLLQSQHDIVGRGHGHGNASGSALRQMIPPTNVFLLDAGTSRFDSSLYWFVCAYQQVILSFFLFHS